MTDPRVRAVVAGTVSLDLVTDDHRAKTARAAVGNSGANIAVRMVHAGAEVDFVCLIGDDEPGARVVEDLERWGVGTAGVVVRPGYRTPLVFQVSAGDGSGADSLSSACPACARPRGHLLELPRVDELDEGLWERIRGADIVVCDTADELGQRILEQAGGVAWFEASLQEAGREAMIGCAAAADIVKVSSDDEDFYRPALDAAVDHAYEVITRGAAGVDWRAPQGERGTIPTDLHEPPVDTIGAGDAFTAAAAVAVGDNRDPLDADGVRAALQAGSRAAADACLAVGARGDMLSAEGGSAWIVEDAPFHCTHCQGR